MNEDFKNRTVGSIVAENWETAVVFDKYNIDYCCKGDIGLEVACAQNDIAVELVSEELQNALSLKPSNKTNFIDWELDHLAEYIESKHHNYVAQKLPEILANLNKICRVHGARHPELLEIRDIFHDVAHELTVHMKKEEFMIFPVIKKMVHSIANNYSIPVPTYGSISNPIMVMMQDHDHEGDNFRKIACLSQQYTVPKDGCSTYRIAYKLLQEFEIDLHKHIHLENNILFPKAVALESAMNRI